MLVSASTVYDKSTLVATYFLKSDKKCACLSLGSKENEINQFIQNFTKAIQTQVPEIGNDILELAPKPPSSIELAEMQVN
jgi:ATP/maltotriose-dependent transcriptional regulator MalT